MTKIKICGITRERDIKSINLAKPDYIGFVFTESKRRISFDKAMELKHLLDRSIKTAGVFVNESIENVATACALGAADLIQLHGDEDNAYIQKLRKRTDKPVIKAVRVKDETDVKAAFDIDCDYVLFDAYMQHSYGGGGKVFNWEFLRGFKKPYFLAGGLNVENVKTALTVLSPFGVDVSSGVETDGLKEEEKIRNFIDAVRRTDHE